MISSFRYIVNSSVKSQNIHFTKFVSDISPGHHSESNLHTPAGHCRWGSPILPTSNSSSTPVQSMEIFLPSRSSSSTQPVSMLNLQALASYFILVSSWNHVVAYVGQSMISDFIFHGHPYWVFRRKQIIRTHLLSETSSDYFCLVRVARIELTASWTPFKRATKTALHPDICKRQIYSLSPLATREHAHIHFLCPSPDDLFILSCRKAFVNCFFTFFFKCVFRAEKRQEKPCSHAGTAKSEKKASRKKLIGKLQEKLGTICEKCKTFCLYIEKRSKAWYIKNATKCNKMDGAFVTLWQIRRDK